MRILQIHNYYQNYGGECHVVDAEKKLLEENGHEVIQFVRHSRDIESWSASKKAVMLASIPYNPIEYSSLLKLANEVQPDVAHVHNVFPLISPSAYSALARAGIPTVQTVHNYRFMCPNGMFFIEKSICEKCQTQGYLSAVINRCMRNSYAISALYAAAIANAWRKKIIQNKISRYIALNQFVFEKMVVAGIPREKIAICGNFIDTENKSVPVKKCYILYIGRLSTEKGVMTLLKAVASLKNVTLKVAGTGPDERILEQYALKYAGDRVEFLGFIKGEHKEKLISEAVCTVVPSEWYENYPISVLESLSLGTPVVASRIGGLPEMVKHGVTGLLFEPEDSLELANCIQDLVDSPEVVAKMAKSAINYSVNTFNSNIHYEQMVEIYQKVINESKR